MRRAIGVACLFGAAAAIAGCAPDLGADLPPPPPTVKLLPPESTTTAPDRSGQILPTVVGDPTTTLVALDNGPVTIGGQVVGPDGAVAGATVRIERLVGDKSGSQDVTSGSDGRFVLAQTYAGRMRLRAWRVPDLVQVTEQLLFVTEKTQIKLQVARHNSTRILTSQAPRQPVVGQQVNVALLLAQEQVTVDGVATARGIPNAVVTMFVTGAIRPNEASPKVTDGAGKVTFNLVCDQVGASNISFSVGSADSVVTNSGLSAQLDPGPCVGQPTTPPSTVPLPSPPTFGGEVVATTPPVAPEPPPAVATTVTP